MGTMTWIVRDRACMRKPMVLLRTDGKNPVPAPGCLFYVMTGYAATIFETKEEAVLAVACSVAWRKKGGGSVEDYEIQSTEDWEVEEEMEKRPRSQKDKTTRAKNPS